MPDASAIASALIARGVTVAIPRPSSDVHDVAIYLLVADHDPQEANDAEAPTA